LRDVIRVMLLVRERCDTFSGLHTRLESFSQWFSN
jgi:hypothetical protein